MPILNFSAWKTHACFSPSAACSVYNEGASATSCLQRVTVRRWKGQGLTHFWGPPAPASASPADAFLQKSTGALNNIQRVTGTLWGERGGLPPSWALLLPQGQPGGGCVSGFLLLTSRGFFSWVFSWIFNRSFVLPTFHFYCLLTTGSCHFKF